MLCIFSEQQGNYGARSERREEYSERRVGTARAPSWRELWPWLMWLLDSKTPKGVQQRAVFSLRPVP